MTRGAPTPAARRGVEQAAAKARARAAEKKPGAKTTSTAAMGKPANGGGPKGIPRAVAPRSPPKEAEPAAPATLEDMANDLKSRYEAEKEIGSLREEKVAKTEEVRWLRE